MLGILRDRARELRRAVERTPVSGIGTLSPGRVAVEGEVRPHRETLPEPIGDGECVVVRYQRLRRNSSGTGPGGETVENRVEVVPFLVDDGTGEILVNPPGSTDGEEGTLLVSAGNTDRYYGDEDATETYRIDAADDEDVEQLAQARQELGESPEWVHVQSAIRPGDHVYVLGQAAETADGRPEHVVLPGDRFLLSDLRRSALVEQLKRESGRIDRSFWLFAVLGLIAVAAIVLVVVILADSFFL